jgi:hypothetical protein
MLEAEFLEQFSVLLHFEVSVLVALFESWQLILVVRLEIKHVNFNFDCVMISVCVILGTEKALA